MYRVMIDRMEEDKANSKEKISSVKKIVADLMN